MPSHEIASSNSRPCGRVGSNFDDTRSWFEATGQNVQPGTMSDSYLGAGSLQISAPIAFQHSYTIIHQEVLAEEELRLPSGVSTDQASDSRSSSLAVVPRRSRMSSDPNTHREMWLGGGNIETASVAMESSQGSPVSIAPRRSRVSASFGDSLW